MPRRPSKTADAMLRAQIENLASLNARERILLALRLGRELATIRVVPDASRQSQ